MLYRFVSLEVTQNRGFCFFLQKCTVTHVEKWNDLAVANRCKHHGMPRLKTILAGHELDAIRRHGHRTLSRKLYAAGQQLFCNPQITQTANLDKSQHSTL